MDPRRRRGAEGEDAAAAWYTARGYRVLARNWRCPDGELDLIAVRAELLVVCEVKARRGHDFGPGFEAVGWRTQRRIRRLAERFLRSAPVAPAAVRFDVASVDLARRRPAVEVFQDAF